MIRATLTLAAALLLAAPAQAVDVVVYPHDVTGGSPANRVVTITLTGPSGQAVAGPWIFAGDSVSQSTGTKGYVGFTNMLALGQYRLDVSGNPPRSFPFSISQTNGTYNVVSLLGTNNSVPVFYDSGQVDALVNALTNGVNVSVTNVVAGALAQSNSFNGTFTGIATGDGSGLTGLKNVAYTNRSAQHWTGTQVYDVTGKMHLWDTNPITLHQPVQDINGPTYAFLGWTNDWDSIPNHTYGFAPDITLGQWLAMYDTTWGDIQQWGTKPPVLGLTAIGGGLHPGYQLTVDSAFTHSKNTGLINAYLDGLQFGSYSAYSDAIILGRNLMSGGEWIKFLGVDPWGTNNGEAYSWRLGNNPTADPTLINDLVLFSPLQTAGFNRTNPGTAILTFHAGTNAATSDMEASVPVLFSGSLGATNEDLLTLSRPNGNYQRWLRVFSEGNGNEDWRIGVTNGTYDMSVFSGGGSPSSASAPGLAFLTFHRGAPNQVVLGAGVVGVGDGSGFTNLNIAAAVGALGTSLSNYTAAVSAAATNNDTLVSVATSNTIATASINSTNQSLKIGAQATNNDAVISGNLTNMVLLIGSNGTNNALLTGANATNQSLLIGANATNQSLLIGLNATNDDLLFGLNGTNQSLKIGAAATNNDTLLSLNGTNQSLLIGASATNNDTLVSLALSNTIATASANATNDDLLFGLNSTNQSLKIGAAATNNDSLLSLNATNEALLIGLNATGQVSAATLALTNGAILNLSNYTAAVAAAAPTMAGNNLFSGLNQLSQLLRADSLSVTNGITNAAWIANTMLYADVNKRATALPSGGFQNWLYASNTWKVIDGTNIFGTVTNAYVAATAQGLSIGSVGTNVTLYTDGNMTNAISVAGKFLVLSNGLGSVTLNGGNQTNSQGITAQFVYSPSGQGLNLGGGQSLSSASTAVTIGSANLNGSGASGQQIGVYVNPAINQSGTAGYVALRVDPTVSATGSGLNDLLELNAGGVTKMNVDASGNQTNAGSIKAPLFYGALHGNADTANAVISAFFSGLTTNLVSGLTATNLSVQLRDAGVHSVLYPNGTAALTMSTNGQFQVLDTFGENVISYSGTPYATESLTLGQHRGSVLFAGPSYTLLYDNNNTGQLSINSSAVTVNEPLQVTGSANYRLPIAAKTANYSVLLGDSGTYFNNNGAVAAVTNTLPTATTVGAHYGLAVVAGQNVAFKASGSDIIRNGTAVSSAGGLVFSSTIGDTIHLYCPAAGGWWIDSTGSTNHWSLQ